MPRSTTIDSVNSQLTSLAAFTDAEIEKAGVYDLRNVLRNLGIHSVNRGNVLVPLRASRKDELVTAVKSLAQRQRDIARAIIPTEETLTPEVDLPTVAETYAELKRLANLSASEIDSATAKLAHSLVTSQALAYPDTPEQKRFNVRCNVRAKFFRRLRELETTDDNYREGYDVVFDRFYKHAMAFGSKDSELKRATATERLNEKAANAGNQPIHLDSLLGWCEGKLKRCTTGLPRTEWKQVTIAVALATGRRCNEVLCTLTTYELQPDGRLTVRGLSKGKDGDVPELADVTTLVDGELVIAGIKWLRDNGKCIVPDEGESDVSAREKVNKRYSKELGQALKGLLVEQEVVPELTKSHTFHALRKFYIMECIRDLSGDRERGKEAARLLGHKNWQTASDNYITEFTLVDEPTW